MQYYSNNLRDERLENHYLWAYAIGLYGGPLPWLDYAKLSPAILVTGVKIEEVVLNAILC